MILFTSYSYECYFEVLRIYKNNECYFEALQVSSSFDYIP